VALRRPIAVLLGLLCVLAIVLAAVPAGVLTDFASDVLLTVGGISCAIWCRSIAEWVRGIGENVPLLSHYQRAQSWMYLVVGVALAFFGLMQMFVDAHHK
jgi:hypothetical protein